MAPGPFLTNECQYNYIIDAMTRIREGGHRYLDLKAEVLHQWRDEMEARSAKSVWTQGGCQTWYVTKEGVNTNNWPGPWLEYKRRTLRVNPDEYQFI